MKKIYHLLNKITCLAITLKGTTVSEINYQLPTDMRKEEKEITAIDEIESIIYKSDVCRIALANGNIPYIVTMNFGYKGGETKRLFFHCAKEGKKLDMIRKNNYVCFEMDTDHIITDGKEACDFSMKYNSVIGWGHIYIADTSKDKIEGLNSIMDHYTNRNDFSYREKSLGNMVILKLDILEMTGKKG